MINCTPDKPRATRLCRKARQWTSCSLSETETPNCDAHPGPRRWQSTRRHPGFGHPGALFRSEHPGTGKRFRPAAGCASSPGCHPAGRSPGWLVTRRPLSHTTLGDRRHFTGGDALDIHLRQRQLQSPLTPQPFLQRLGIKAAFPHLRHIEGDFAHPGLDRLGLVAIGMPLPLRGALERCYAKTLLPFDFHGGVDYDPDQFRQNIEALWRNLFQHFRR